MERALSFYMISQSCCVYHITWKNCFHGTGGKGLGSKADGASWERGLALRAMSLEEWCRLRRDFDRPGPERTDSASFRRGPRSEVCGQRRIVPHGNGVQSTERKAQRGGAALDQMGGGSFYRIGHPFRYTAAWGHTDRGTRGDVQYRAKESTQTNGSRAPLSESEGISQVRRRQEMGAMYQRSLHASAHHLFSVACMQQECDRSG